MPATDKIICETGQCYCFFIVGLPGPYTRYYCLDLKSGQFQNMLDGPKVRGQRACVWTK